MNNLLTNLSRVESPFIIVTIAGYSFGLYDKETKNVIEAGGAITKIKAQYPNYMQSITINKINGAINTYTINMVYGIRAGDDPNLLEKVFSAASKDRKIKISYGDLSLPTFIYKEERGIITKITSNIDINNSNIHYTLQCTSEALSLKAGTYSFQKRTAKPSDIIKEILYNVKYGLVEVFYGMRDKNLVLSKNLIAGDDREVTIEAKRNISVFDYLNYLVTCMSNVSDKNTDLLKHANYALIVVDDITGIFNGPYFKVVKIATQMQSINSLDMYEIDIGYPGTNIVMNFSVDTDETYSILYNYSKKIQQPDYIYRIDNNGTLNSIYSPTLALSNQLLKTTEPDKTWWTKVTQYPINATVVLKGLLRPAILMTYLNVNVLFYGQKHIASGIYIITKQTDTIDASGFKTTLNITRIKGMN